MIAYIIREIFTDALCVPENIRAGDSRGRVRSTREAEG